MENFGIIDRKVDFTLEEIGSLIAFISITNETSRRRGKAKLLSVWNVRSHQQEPCDPTCVQPCGGGGGGDVQVQKRRGANNEPVQVAR